MGAEEQGRLRVGTVSPIGIVFMVVATAAPLTAMATALPLAVGLGNGVGAPGAYLLVAAVLGLFAVGYSAMSTQITNAGAFYAYVTAGLGRPLGMAAGLVAVLAYNVLVLYVVGLIGFFAHQTFLDELGVDLPWWLYAGLALTIALVVGIRGLELNVRVLGVLLIVETTLLLVFDVASLLRDGGDVLPTAAFDPSQVFSGSPGLALLFAVTCFIGFEATAIFGEEARDPRRTVPRATYAAIAFVGTLYVVTTWVMVGTNGGAEAGAVAARDPGVFTFDAFAIALGGWSRGLVSWLLLTSLLAVLMALHNMASRYLMAFGREGVLPHALGRTHPRFQTPHVAALAQAGGTALLAAVYALAGADPYLNLGSQTAGVGTLAVICLMAACSFSVPFFFARRGRLRPWHHLIAPVAAGLALSFFAFLIVNNYALVSGSTSGVVNRLPLLLLVVAAVGFAIGARRSQRTPLDALTAATPRPEVPEHA
ncbi:APC family permease [Patulibacter defluvii]|uniref:APC family permease n=1 Tax=Patulibacter defluvii TaxID=3095358 RepID=UPI002A74833C|nr:APC family permease [Patulibacter sp. DM4]